MISIYGLIALMIISAAATIAWLMKSGSKLEIVNDTDMKTMPIAEESTPIAEEWCKLIEELFECEAFCFDERLCSVSTNLHLVDLAPPDASSAVLELVAAVRRGNTLSKDVTWKGKNVTARAAPLGKKWILLCIRTNDNSVREKEVLL